MRIAVFSALLALAVVVGLVISAEGQVIIQKGDGGGAVFAPAGGVYGLLHKLSDSEGWTEARDALIEKARGGDHIEVILAVEKFRPRDDAELVAERLSAVLDALEQDGLYPLGRKDIDEQLTSLRELVSDLEGRRGSLPIDALRVLVDARKDLERAKVAAETGEVPSSGPNGGGVIIRRTKGE